MTKDIANAIAEKLHGWMSEQKYGNESLLHAAVCCDLVGVAHFKNRMAAIIKEEINKAADDHLTGDEGQS